MYKFTRLYAFIILSSNLYQPLIFAQSESSEGYLNRNDPGSYDPYYFRGQYTPEDLEQIRRDEENIRARSEQRANPPQQSDTWQNMQKFFQGK
jgi:hypothetical protein